ncbi:MAG: RNA polymerase sigma factor [Thermoleophilaceae bacterium]
MEASALQRQAGLPGVHGRSPLLRLRSDEQLIAATRRGNEAAFETLVQRYQPRLLAFCRHMLGSKEDAEDVLQEVFAAAYNALLADERPINTRPWLYRIARNRSLNHLRKPRATGQDSMDIFEREHGITAADTVHRREEFRQIVSDVGHLPESQRTALLLREIDAMSYDQISEAMDTTVPSVKSLLVRARVSLAEAAEARLLTCAEVRLELGEVAEGLGKTSAPVRRHLKACDRCQVFRSELRKTSKALAAVYPIGPMILLHHLGFVKVGLAKLGLGGAAASGTAAGGTGAAAGGAGIAAGGAAAAASGGAAAAGGAISAGIGTVAGKAAAGMAAAALVTAGAVEVKHVTKSDPALAPPAAVSAAPTQPPPPAPAKKPKKASKGKKAAATAPAAAKKPEAAEAAPAETETTTTTTTTPATPPAAPLDPDAIQEEEGTVVLPPTKPADPPADGSNSEEPTTTTPSETTSPPSEETTTTPTPASTGGASAPTTTSTTPAPPPPPPAEPPPPSG